MTPPTRFVRWAALVAALLALAPATRAEDAPTPAPEAPPESAKPAEPAPAAKPAPSPKPPTVVVEKGPFAPVLEAAGTFAPVGAAEVAYEPEALGGEFEVLEAAAPGPVEKGQVLVRLSSERADEQVKQAERDLSIAEQNLARQRADAARAADAARNALERARLEADRAKADLRLFLEKNREIRTREAELRLKGAEDRIAEDEEELAQLKRMYDADEVVEETEAIVMRRATRALERARIGYEFQKEGYRQFLEVELPAQQRGLELTAEREALEASRAEETTPPALEAARLELAKAESALERQAKTLEKLRKDLAGLVLVAPRSGLAVPGAFARGKWAGVEETARLLEKKGKARAGQVLFTIVEPGAVSFVASVPEATVLLVEAGQSAKVVPTAAPHERLSARVRSVEPVAGDGGHLVVLEVRDAPPRLLPGFTGKAKIDTAGASLPPLGVTVPESAVGSVDGRSVVHLVAEDGATDTREVRLGMRVEGRVLVVEGLSGGERILKTAPK